MAHLYNDSDFYGLAAELAQIADVCGPATNNILRLIGGATDEQRAQAEEASADRIIIGPEHLTIEELFDSTFKYSSLDGLFAFRILVLHSGSPSEVVRATIQHDVLRVKGQSPDVYYTPTMYEALSYVWGAESKPCSILLNGCKMMITQSLHDALVRLRYPHKDRKLWVDSLSINQSDSKEKAAQVALMPKIYTYAAKVLVHLGEQSNNSEILPDLLKRVAGLTHHEIGNKISQPEGLVSLGLPSATDHSWRAIIDFFCRPWFSRTWIIQEAVLARDVRFFCGDWELKWRLIAEMGERFDTILSATSQKGWSADYLGAQRAAASVALMRGFQFSRSVVAKRLQHLEEDIESTSLHAQRRIDGDGLAPNLAAKRDLVVQSCRKYSELFPLLERMFFALDSVIPSSTPILKLLGMFSYHQASIPRDRLYALIGLAGDINVEEFPPDYDEIPESTNARFSRALVKKGQGMDVLFHATKLSIQLRNVFLPSWSPDWTLRQESWRHWLNLGWAYSQYPAGFDGRVCSTDFVSLVDGNAWLLKVSGARLDRFQNSEPIVKIGLDEIKPSTVREACNRFLQQSELLMSGSPYFTGESWHEVQCRTLVADHLQKRGGSSLEALEQYIETKRRFASSLMDQQLGPQNSWSSKWFDLMPLYASCKTSRGYVGLVPEATSANDEVFMLLGSDLPFVLRPIQALPGVYRFIGGCYMHGLMKGNAWKHVQTPTDVFLR